MNSFSPEEGIFRSGSQTKSSKKYISPTVQTLDVGVSILTTSDYFFIQYIGTVSLVNTVTSIKSVGFFKTTFCSARNKKTFRTICKVTGLGLSKLTYKLEISSMLSL